MASKKPTPGKISKALPRDHRGEIFGIIYNVIAILIAIYASYADYTRIVFYLTVAYPLIGVVMLMFGIGRVKFIIITKSRPLSSIIYGFLVLGLVSYFVVAKRFDLLTYRQFWLPFICVSITMALFLITTALDKLVFVGIQILLMIAISAAYAAGTVIQTNCVFDDSPPMKFNTVVQDKKIIKKRKSGPVYHLILSPWERGQSPIEIEVSSTEYEQTPVDGPVGGHIKRGLLGIKWFYMDM